LWFHQLTVPSCCCVELVGLAILQEADGSGAQRLGGKAKQQEGIGMLLHLYLYCNFYEVLYKIWYLQIIVVQIF